MTTQLKMSEDQLQDAVIEMAHRFKWRVAHFRPVRIQRRDGSVYYQTPVQADGAGFPDLVLVRDRVLWVELKSEEGRLSVEQQDWMFALGAADQERHIWRPVHWRDGTIEEVLRPNN